MSTQIGTEDNISSVFKIGSYSDDGQSVRDIEIDDFFDQLHNKNNKIKKNRVTTKERGLNHRSKRIQKLFVQRRGTVLSRHCNMVERVVLGARRNQCILKRDTKDKKLTAKYFNQYSWRYRYMLDMAPFLLWQRKKEELILDIRRKAHKRYIENYISKQ